jgi:hypothetical protein
MIELKRYKLDPTSDELVRQYINRNSILEDLRTAAKYNEFAIGKYLEWEAIANNPDSDSRAPEIITLNALWQSTVLHYTRCFNSSATRGHIELKNVLAVLNEDNQETHKQIMELRNAFTAHHGGNVDYETLNVFGIIIEQEGNVIHRIESIGTRALVFDLQVLHKFHSLFTTVLPWYETEHAQQITNALGNKYSPIHEKMFKEGK